MNTINPKAYRRPLASKAGVFPLIGLFFISLVQVLAVEPHVVKPAFVPEDAKPFRGNWYKYFEKKGISWHDAQRECEKMGGHLATVPDQETWDFIISLGSFCFLGANDAEKAGEWKWIDGTLFDFTAWYSGKPDNPIDEAGYLHTEYYAQTGGIWNHGSGEGGNAYICQWKPQPFLFHKRLEAANPDIAEAMHLLRQEVAVIESDYNTRVTSINKNYNGAIQREMETSTSRGDLELTVQLRDELQRIKENRGAGEHDAKTFPRLSRLRFAYRQETEKLRKIHKTKVMAVFKRNDIRLNAIQIKLTKAKEIDQALEVQTLRKTLMAFPDSW